MPATEVRLDLVMNNFNLVIRRVTVFIGLSSNATRQRPPVSHVLDPSHRMRIAFVPDDVSENQAMEYVEEFDKWVIGNGLRDIIDCTSSLITEIYAANLIATKMNATPAEVFRKEVDKFSKKAIRDQAYLLCMSVGIDNKYGDIFESWRRARNCLAHRLGIVGRPDIDSSGYLIIKWVAMRLVALNEDGNKEFNLSDGIAGPFGADTELRLRFNPVEKRFGFGDQIAFTTTELAEICFAANWLGNKLMEEFIQVMEAQGHIFDDPQGAKPPQM